MSQAGHSLLVIKSPEERFSLKNVAVVNNGMRPSSVPEGKCIYGSVGKDVYLTLEFSSKIPSGKIALSSLQREWLGVDLGDTLSVGLYKIANQISTISLELDFFSKTKKATPAIDTDQLATSFSQTFSDNVFCAGQQVLMGFEKFPMLKTTVLKVSAVDPRTLTGSSKKVSNKFGRLFNSTITFEKKSDSSFQLIGRHKGDSAHTAIISPDCDFNQMGIGGVHKEYSDIFQRTFSISEGLPDENRRLEILNILTAQMVKHEKLTADVDVKLLAERTQNFSGAELEGLVRSAQATAMNKLIKAKDKNLVTREEADKLQVTMADFQHALDYDVKPAFGISEDELDNYAFNGIIQWSSQVQDILDMGELAFKQAIESQRTPLVSLLLRGNPGSGKTTLAANIAKRSGFPFVKVISPENMVGFSEGAKCQAIKKVFDDAYKSELSCVVVDDIERLLDYVAIGPRFSNLVVQALLVLLRKKPPTITGKPPHKLLIIGTTGFNDDVLQMLGISDAFDRCIEIPYINSGNHLLEILKESGVTGFTDEQIKLLEKRLKSQSCFVGIKKLLSLIEAARLRPDCVPNFIARLEQEAGLTSNL